MQTRKTLITSTAAFILAAGIAQADTTTFTNPDGVWNNINNWDNGIPTEADRAVIPNGKICHVNLAAAVADTVEIEDGGELIIDAGKKLSLDSDNDNDAWTPDQSQIDGTLTLDDSGSVLAFIDHNHRLYGNGNIVGKHNYARIDIDADKELTNRLSNSGGGISGALQIKGLTGGTDAGKFDNAGNVVANKDGGTLLLHEDTLLDDQPFYQAKWKATDVGTLEFGGASHTLEGDIIIDCGIVYIADNISLCGTFTFENGRLIVATDKFFAYEDYYSYLGNTNPQNSLLTNENCTNWQVDDTSSSYTYGTCIPG